jgi:hypothetical protein
LKVGYHKLLSTVAFNFNLRRYIEMRTQLNGVITVNQLMLETDLDTEQRELAGAYTRPLFGLT